jgi:transposase
MEHYAGIDVSLELSNVCVVDAQGKIVKEAKVASQPEALVTFFEALGFAVKRIELEAGPLSQWLHAGLKRAEFENCAAPSLRQDLCGSSSAKPKF